MNFLHVSKIVMEQFKLKKCSVPLCDLSHGYMKNKLNKLIPQRTSQRVMMQKKLKKEVESEYEYESESDSLKEAETSEVENVTPERKLKKESESEYECESDSSIKETKVKKEVFKDSGKSDYEKMIQRNRERSLAFLQSLNLDEVKESYCNAVQKLKPKKRTYIKRPATTTSPPVLRKSRRLAKKDVDFSEDALIQRAVVEAMEEVEQIEELPENLKFEEALRGKEIYSKFVHNFSELDYKKNEKSYEIISHLERMKISESQVAKVVPARITALTIHPVLDKIIITAADKYGNVGFWNMNSDANPFVFRPHLEGVTNIKYNPYDSNQVLSSSYDGTLRCGDMEKQIFNEVYNVSSKICCTYFDVLSKMTFIVGHKTGDVALVDCRDKKSLIKTHSCHDYTVKSVCVHPVDKNYFITSEVKGTIKLWDLRKLQRKPVVDVQHHRKSVASAFFSPLSGNSILSTCSDDSLCIFDSSNLSVDIPLKKSIKHNNFTGRWLSVFKAIWIPNTEDTFVVGSMKYPRRIEVFNDNGNNIFNFMDEDLSTITSLHAFHPSLPVLAGGNSSGKVFVFTDTI